MNNHTQLVLDFSATIVIVATFIASYMCMTRVMMSLKRKVWSGKAYELHFSRSTKKNKFEEKLGMVVTKSTKTRVVVMKTNTRRNPIYYTSSFKSSLFDFIDAM